ncbi:GAF domain-containing hybrid sensor histidine kinase/response regulator [Alteromonas sp. PRIM-21]|uniref:GAF domain-containing hybrid sensor histidine kinase/response regulator n=1 Tax=Alteromonas sp. PRIM-21 TaxID=1454978 RepID=UPI0022B9CBA1|nr:ATP-binding protein [Alteromonas sp. PRIM-21]MCZ8531526.1 response regulator [Alteromonas sp. PRIM-21]
MSIIRDLQEISNDKAMSLDKKLESLLCIGTEALRLETGIVSNIQGELYSVLSVVTPNADIPKGAEFSLCDTYCADAARADSVIAYHNIDVQPGASHPCFDKYTLKSYLASPIRVFGEFYGTVNFSSLSSRDEPFNELETDYLLLLATWIGNELERQQSMSNLNAQKVVFEERNSLLKQVTNLAGVGTWELDIESGSVIWSGALKRMFHVHSERSMQAEDILKFIPDEVHRKRYAEQFEQMKQTGEDFLYEVEIRTDAGETRWIESRAHPIMDNGRCVKVVGATVDITQMHIDKAVLQHKSDLAQNALKARGDFLANMSQEIRTPIHGVQGMLEALMASPLNPKQMELASHAVQSADSLLNIVNDILDFSKIDAGELVFEDAPTNFEETIEEQIPMFTRLAQEKGLTFSVNTAALKGQTFIADKLRLGQVLINLVNNAFKFTKAGEVTVETRCVRYGKGRYRVKLIVTDTGIGISAQQQKIIFTPFMQADSSTQRMFGGTGLGLSIVKQIVEHYNGKIEVSSELGIGARFTVTLTLDDANAGAITDNTVAQNDAYIPSKEELRAFKALVVEDNEINQLVIKEQLREIGITSDLAVNGEEAVEKVKRSMAEKSPYALIFMDCHMPIMDGLEATKQIRLLDQEAAQIPIIALTANVSTGEKEKCLKSGMDDFISKPVGVSRLKECVFRHLSKHFENKVSALKDPA